MQKKMIPQNKSIRGIHMPPRWDALLSATVQTFKINDVHSTVHIFLLVNVVVVFSRCMSVFPVLPVCSQYCQCVSSTGSVFPVLCQNQVE